MRGRGGGGGALGGPDVNGHGVHCGAYVPFLPSDGGRSGAEGATGGPCDGEAGPNRWSAVVSRKRPAATTDTARRYVPPVWSTTASVGHRARGARSGHHCWSTTPAHTHLLGQDGEASARPPPPDARTPAKPVRRTTGGCLTSPGSRRPNNPAPSARLKSDLITGQGNDVSGHTDIFTAERASPRAGTADSNPKHPNSARARVARATGFPRCAPAPGVRRSQVPTPATPPES